MSIKLGIGSWSYPWAIGVAGYPNPQKVISVFDLLNKAISLKVDVIQYCDNLPLHHLTEPELNELKERAVKAGISLEVGTRGIETENIIKYINIAQQLDANLIRTVITGTDYHSNLGKAVKLIKKIIPKLEETGVNLAIENHEKHTAEELAYIIREVDSDYVGICLDTVNSFGAMETPGQIIAELSPYVINLHFKDFVIERVDHQMGLLIRGCQPGKGQLDINWLLGSIIKKNKNLSIILEQWPPFNKTIEETVAREEKWVYEGIKFLKNRLF